ncbi:response regulator transcription factor [Sinobaca sp. H24]|uniref:response regulator transcription factor n=1 Tax=Sinobaca sp. H24 TaxID=2923376 RepID=UPI00207A1E57|nr:response regulator transcription factor [Sinobaca sp. H24]
MIHILLAEDQNMVRQGLKVMIETDESMLVSGEAANGLEAIELCQSGKFFDIAILDIRMPVMDGLKAAKKLHEDYPRMKILMLTTFNDDEYAIEALKNGARGYLLKNADTEELIRSIHTCLEGGLVLESHVAAKVLPNLIGRSPQEKQFLDPSLTEREVALICCVGKGMNNKEIADTLHLSIGTVKNQISVILDKLELRDRTQLAIYAIRNQMV